MKIEVKLNKSPCCLQDRDSVKSQLSGVAFQLWTPTPWFFFFLTYDQIWNFEILGVTLTCRSFNTAYFGSWEEEEEEQTNQSTTL